MGEPFSFLHHDHLSEAPIKYPAKNILQDLWPAQRKYISVASFSPPPSLSLSLSLPILTISLSLSLSLSLCAHTYTLSLSLARRHSPDEGPLQLRDQVQPIRLRKIEKKLGRNNAAVKYVTCVKWSILVELLRAGTNCPIIIERPCPDQRSFSSYTLYLVQRKACVGLCGWVCVFETWKGERECVFQTRAAYWWHFENAT